MLLCNALHPWMVAPNSDYLYDDTGVRILDNSKQDITEFRDHIKKNCQHNDKPILCITSD